jgi:hypothetical protein
MKRLSVLMFVIVAFAGGVVVGARLEPAEAARETCASKLSRTRTELVRAQQIAEAEMARATRAEADLARQLEKERQRVQKLEAMIGQLLPTPLPQ